MQAATIISHGSGNCHAVAMICAKTAVTKTDHTLSRVPRHGVGVQPPPQNAQERGEGRHIGHHHRPALLVERRGDPMHRGSIRHAQIDIARQPDQKGLGHTEGHQAQAEPDNHEDEVSQHPFPMRTFPQLRGSEHQPGPGKAYQVQPSPLLDLQERAAIGLDQRDRHAHHGCDRCGHQQRTDQVGRPLGQRPDDESCHGCLARNGRPRNSLDRLRTCPTAGNGRRHRPCHGSRAKPEPVNETYQAISAVGDQ